MEGYLGLSPLLGKVRVPHTHMNIAWPAAQVASSGFCGQADPGLRPASQLWPGPPRYPLLVSCSLRGCWGTGEPPARMALPLQEASRGNAPPSSFVRVLPWPCRGCQGQQNSLASSAPSLLSRWLSHPPSPPKNKQDTAVGKAPPSPQYLETGRHRGLNSKAHTQTLACDSEGPGPGPTAPRGPVLPAPDPSFCPSPFSLPFSEPSLLASE